MHQNPNKVERLAAIVGGNAVIAHMCGISRSLITRYAKEGEIPQRYRRPIEVRMRDVIEKRYPFGGDRDAALTAALDCLPPAVCPHCGASTEGKVL